MTKSSGPLEPDTDPDKKADTAPAAVLGPDDVACPACGATAHRPGLRHQCSACGVRFDVVRVEDGIVRPAQSGPLLEARLDEPCPVSTIDDCSDADHVRWLVIRRNGRRGIGKVLGAIAFLLYMDALFWGGWIEKSSIWWAIGGVVILAISVWWIRYAILEYFRREELILDKRGLTRVRRTGSRVWKLLVPLHLIRFFKVGHVGGYQGGDVYVSVYHAHGDVIMASFLGYRNLTDYEWVIRQLASGCALLLDTKPEEFLIAEVEQPDARPLGKDAAGVASKDEAPGDQG